MLRVTDPAERQLNRAPQPSSNSRRASRDGLPAALFDTRSVIALLNALACAAPPAHSIRSSASSCRS